jgi:hypothetical protein
MSKAVDIKLHGGAVRLTLAAHVAGNLGALQKGLTLLTCPNNPLFAAPVR